MVKIKSSSTCGGLAKQAERVGIFGASGCGKTTKARQLIKPLRRVIFFEPLKDDLLRLQNEDKFKIVVGLHDLFCELQRSYRKGFKIAYYPTPNFEEIELSTISNALTRAQDNYGLQHNAQITLVIDELDLSFPTGISLRDKRNGFKNLCCRGRHTGINIIGLSQRMHLVDNVFRANCSAFYIYRHFEPADIDTGVKILGKNYRETLEKLNNFEYIYKAGAVIYTHK